MLFCLCAFGVVLSCSDVVEEGSLLKKMFPVLNLEAHRQIKMTTVANKKKPLLECRIKRHVVQFV